MRRRALFAALFAAAALRALAAPAQARQRRIVFVSRQPAADIEAFVAELRKALAKLDWLEGRTLAPLRLVATRSLGTELERVAAQVVAEQPDLVLAQTVPVVAALKKATTAIPIVMVAVGEAVRNGLVASLAAPGGNVTGSTYLAGEGVRKAIALLREAVPAVRGVAVLADSTARLDAEFDELAAQLGLRIRLVVLAAESDPDAAFRRIAAERLDSAVLSPDPVARGHRHAIAARAQRERLPLAVSGGMRYLVPGALLSFGPGFDAYPALTARYVDAILRGASPAAMPVEQPASFELGVSEAVARHLGIRLPAALVARADRVDR